jgi:glycosyltransferase involved in cell wall biosynthesis
MKVFEYMSLAKPVLAPALPPLRDVIDSGVDGLLFDAGEGAARAAGEAGDLGAALMSLLDDAPARARLGAAARAKVGERHTWQRNLARALEALGEAVP